MKYDEIVTGESQTMNGLQDRLRLAQEVGEEHNQAAMLEHGSDLEQAGLDVSRSGRLEPGQERQNVAELRPLAPGCQALTNLLIERDQPNGILLVNHQVAESS